MWGRILEALKDMSVSEPFDKQLQSLLNERGFTFKKELLPDPNDLKKIRHYTDVGRVDFKFALVQLPGWFLKVPDTFGNFSISIQRIKDRPGRIISPNLDVTAGGYVTALRSISARDVHWKFVPWHLVQEVFDGTMQLEDAFDMPALAVPPGGKQGAAETGDPKLDGDDAAFVKKMLADHADASGLDDVKKFFSKLVGQLDLPAGFVGELNNRFDNDAPASAATLLAYLGSKGQYGAASPHKGDFFIGRLLINRLDYVGSEDEKEVARIISRRNLIVNPNDLARIKAILDG
jgi:hypothetical protein